jgi:uncharacterized membrane protein SpoIIM required for sporulation
MSFSIHLSQIFKRNQLLIGIVAFTFLLIVTVSALVAYVLLIVSPGLITMIQSLTNSTRGYVTEPTPYTVDFYRLIFFNNIGHFWNPSRVWVWIPFVGMFSLGYELILNAVVIGGVISFAALTRGAAFTVAGLTPHGVLEIPAFILEFAGLARWHVASIRAVYTKLGGRTVDRPLLIQGIKDTIFLSLLSVALFAVAAYVETYITPRFLGL